MLRERSQEVRLVERSSDEGAEAVRHLGRVLGVWAHPDDETYLSGALMAFARANGQQVVCVTATAGERGTSDPDRWPPEELAKVRREELAEALGLLGVEEHHWLDYADGGCASVPDDEAVERIADLVRSVRPDTLVTFDPSGMTGHADHVTVSRWATEAWRRVGGTGRLLYAVKTRAWLDRFAELHATVPVFDPGYPRTVPESDLALRLLPDDETLDVKIRALRCQESQVAPVIEAVGEDTWREWNAEEAFVLATSPAMLHLGSSV